MDDSVNIRITKTPGIPIGDKPYTAWFSKHDKLSFLDMLNNTNSFGYGDNAVDAVKDLKEKHSDVSFNDHYECFGFNRSELL